MTPPDVAADRVAAVKRLFPAKFTDTIIDVLEEEIRGRMLGVGTLLDPCVGVGGIHELAERMPGLYTVGVDIEEEFAACHERSVHGDSTTLGVPGATARTRLERVLDGRKVNAVGVSFPYGNRLSDQYLGSENEKCRKCMGRGWVPSKEWAKANGSDTEPSSSGSADHEQCPKCPKCAGSGKAKSDRQGYVFAKGDRLTVGSGAAVAFGSKYVSIHQRIMDGTARFVSEHRDVALPFWWFVNVSSFIKDGAYVPVMEWWVGEIARHAEVVAVRAVETPRHGFGQNAEKRVPVEHVIIARS